MRRRIAFHGVPTAAAFAAAMGIGSATGWAAEPVTFVTNWKAQAEHGGFYQAVAKGFYEKYGLDVRIRPGGPGVNTRQLIAAGAVDFAMASNNDYALELVRAGAKVKAVMAAFQKSPQMLMTHVGNGIESLEDMKGRPILISSGNIHTMWVWLKAKYGFEDSQIRKYTFNMAPFIANKDTIQQGYISSEPFIVKEKAGIDVKSFLLADNGYQTYAALVLAPERWIADKPEAVRGFVNASIEGWKDYIYGDPSAANVMIKQHNKEMTDATIVFSRKTMKQYGIVDSGDTRQLGIGAMTDARWKDHFETAASQGRYPKDLPYGDAYTLRFVNKKHGMTN